MESAATIIPILFLTHNYAPILKFDPPRIIKDIYGFKVRVFYDILFLAKKMCTKKERKMEYLKELTSSSFFSSFFYRLFYNERLL